MYHSINQEARDIAFKLGIVDRIPKKEAFIMLEGHKTNLASNSKCWLMNPAKSEIGEVSK